jgi:hypothetical protein
MNHPVQKRAGLATATTDINNTHTGLKACPSSLFFQTFPVGFKIQAPGLLIAFHQISGTGFHRSSIKILQMCNL